VTLFLVVDIKLLDGRVIARKVAHLQAGRLRGHWRRRQGRGRVAFALLVERNR
jgi:hypothetical protein